MKTEIKTKRFNEWPVHIRKRLWKLTMRESSGMRDTLHVIPNARTYVLFEDSNPVAWSLIAWDNFTHEWDFMIYVRRDRRRNRYGTKLYKEMKRFMKKMKGPYVVYADEANKKFWESLNEKRVF